MYVVALAADWPIPCKTAEKIAANNEGMIKLKKTLFESITPFSLILLLIRVWEKETINPVMKPIPVAAPGL